MDFLASFGIMLAGVFLLFFSSVYFATGSNFSFLQFPTSGKRAEAVAAIYPENLPASKPAAPLAKNEDNANLLPVYEVTMDYLRHLGLNSLEELPNYAELHKHPYITNLDKEE